MPIESETLSMLYIGFFLIIGLVLIVIIKLWYERKNKSFIWFIAQIIFLSFSFFMFTELIKPNTDIPAAFLSEENSFTLGITGILWATSMVCMIIGIWYISRRRA